MVPITKDEAMYLRKLYPNIHIAMVNRQASKAKRKRRYIEESPTVLNALDEYRTSIVKVVFDSKEVGGNKK